VDFQEIERIRSRRVGINVTLPTTLVEVVDRYAEAYTNSDFSAAVLALVRRGLKGEAEDRKSQ
jgi:metal-responsive CopG/Arc/MetJ family transcriptional regulator